MLAAVAADKNDANVMTTCACGDVGVFKNAIEDEHTHYRNCLVIQPGDLLVDRRRECYLVTGVA